MQSEVVLRRHCGSSAPRNLHCNEGSWVLGQHRQDGALRWRNVSALFDVSTVLYRANKLETTPVQPLFSLVFDCVIYFSPFMLLFSDTISIHISSIKILVMQKIPHNLAMI